MGIREGKQGWQEPPEDGPGRKNVKVCGKEIKGRARRLCLSQRRQLGRHGGNDVHKTHSDFTQN